MQKKKKGRKEIREENGRVGEGEERRKNGRIYRRIEKERKMRRKKKST